MIETNRLIIRKMTIEDFNSLNKIFSDKKTMEFWSNPFTEKEVRKWIQKNINNYRNYGFGRWVIILKKNKKIIGDIGYLCIEINGKIENDLGYIIYSKYWGKGYATEGAKACLNHGFNKLGMERIVANMPYNHYASQKVAKKVGMKKETEFINKKNRNIPTYIYSKEKQS